MAEDKKYYAWSNIHFHDGEKLEVIKPGTVVTQEKLGYDDDAWDEILEGGAVRSTPWPKGLDPENPNAMSPNEHRLAQLRNQRESLESEMAGVGGSSTQDDNAASSSSSSSAPSTPSGGNA